MVLQFRCLSPFWGQQRFAKGVCFSPRGPISSGVSQSSPLMFPSLQGTVAEHCKSVTCSFSTAGLQPLSRIRKPQGPKSPIGSPHRPITFAVLTCSSSYLDDSDKCGYSNTSSARPLIKVTGNLHFTDHQWCR